jgi:transcriptional regulator with XRE-family HTH domain
MLTSFENYFYLSLAISLTFYYNGYIPYKSRQMFTFSEKGNISAHGGCVMQKSNSYSTTGKRIEGLRKDKGLTQAELASQISAVLGREVRRETVVQWESIGDSNTSGLKDVYTVALADFFDTTCDYILRGVKSENVDINRATGLSNTAIEYMRMLKEECPDDIELLNTMFEDYPDIEGKPLDDLFFSMNKYLNELAFFDEQFEGYEDWLAYDYARMEYDISDESTPCYLNKRDLIKHMAEEMSELYAYRIDNAVKALAVMITTRVSYARHEESVKSWHENISTIDTPPAEPLPSENTSPPPKKKRPPRKGE